MHDDTRANAYMSFFICRHSRRIVLALRISEKFAKKTIKQSILSWDTIVSSCNLFDMDRRDTDDRRINSLGHCVEFLLQ